jgi:hypothetical protein
MVGRTQTWELAGTSLIGPPSRAKLESQLNAMFGGQVFDEPTRLDAVAPRRSIRPARRRAALPLFVLCLATAATIFVVTREVRNERERALVAHDLAGFLRSGALREADEALDRAYILARHSKHARVLAPLMARAEATLYHYVDSSEERKRDVEQILAVTGEGTFDAAVARALITPVDELVDLQGVLQVIADETRDPEATFLLGMSLDAAGRTKAADRMFERALDLEPSHLPHLAMYAVWSKRIRRLDRTNEVLDQMRTIDPDSPWIGWVEDQIQ